MRAGSIDARETTDQRFEVAEGEAGMRLDRFLAGRAPGLSRSRLSRLVREGRVQVLDRRARPRAVKAGLALVPGDTVELQTPPPAPSALEPEDRPLAVLFEDDDLAVVLKPPGMPTHPGPGWSSGTLVHVLLARLSDLSGVGGVERPGIVHRLDKDTSGVVVVAKNDTAHEALQEQFRARTVHKRYLALVLGRMGEREGTIDRPLARDRGDRTRMRSGPAPGAREAVTRWRVLEELGPASLLEVRPETGRTHQIRAHLADGGHPVVGDETYGFDARVRGVSDPGWRRSLQAAPRSLLHASALELRHPRTGEALRVEAPLPRDFEAVLADLRARAGREDR